MRTAIGFLTVSLLFCSAICDVNPFEPYNLEGQLGGYKIPDKLCRNLALTVSVSYCGGSGKADSVSVRPSGSLWLAVPGAECSIQGETAQQSASPWTYLMALEQEDTRQWTGSVHYVIMTEKSHIQKLMAEYVNQVQNEFSGFTPSEVVVVTYNKTFSDSMAMNFFQVMLASTGTTTLLIYAYHNVNDFDGKITTGCSEGMITDAESINNYVHASNVGQNGLYIYDITSATVTTSLSKLYPFGSSVGDRSSGENSIRFTFPFNQLIFRSVSVCSSGYVTFEPQDCYESCVATRSVIAPFWLGDANDLWKGVTTDVFYRVSYDETMLATVQNDIQGCIGDKIEPVKVLVATWIHSRHAKKNMFQMALATDGKSSYAVYKYPKLEYSSVTDEWGETTYARALMVSHSCAASRLPETEVSAKQSASILDLQHQTNCKRADLEGVFVYRVDSDLPSLQGASKDWSEYLGKGSSENINRVCKSARTQQYGQMCAEAGPSYYEPTYVQTGNRYGYARDGYHSYYERPYGYAGYADDRGREGYNPHGYNPYGARVNYYPQNQMHDANYYPYRRT